MVPDELSSLVIEFTKLPNETEWLEFKHNVAEPKKIGERISALSNSAALLGKSQAFIIWGVDDKTHEILGTSFKPRSAKVTGEELEHWLIKNLDPKLDFRIHEFDIGGKPVVVIEIPPAPNQPVRFMNIAYIRVGSYTHKLRKYPEKEKSLFRTFDQVPFEKGIAKHNASSDEVLGLIDYPKYFKMMDQPLPDNRQAILERLSAEHVLISKAEDLYDITNVGAILFATDLTKFDRLARKAIRIVFYKGNNRVEAIKERLGKKGYASGFEGFIRFINDQIPQNEQIGQALRKEERMYPEIAIRELYANALIHQDFNITGSGPMVEVFSDRMEITNPGIPLIDTLRFIDEPPRSRNEILAGLMRRMNICEERGSGIDKVIFNIELFQLPAPDFRVAGSSTVAVLYGPRSFAQMDRNERIRACYQHASLQYVSGKTMSNSSLRKRLGIEDKNYPQASRIIKDSIGAGLIKPAGEGTGSRKDASYVPIWA